MRVSLAVIMLFLSSNAICDDFGAMGALRFFGEYSEFWRSQQDEQRCYEDEALNLCGENGGRVRFFRGATRCVYEGLVLDTSCLRLPTTQRRMVLSSLAAIRNQGTLCFRHLGGDALFLADRLVQHLSEVPRTQVCCAVNCDHSVFPARTDTPDPLVFADTEGAAGEDEGTVRILPRLLASDGTVMQAVLFHEFLHRIGLCRIETHEMATSSWIAAIQAAQQQHLAPGQSASSCALTAPLTLPPGTRFSSSGSSCCIARCGSREGECLTDRFGLVADDPIYACERECFGFPAHVDGDAETCRRGAALSEREGWRGAMIARPCPR